MLRSGCLIGNSMHYCIVLTVGTQDSTVVTEYLRKFDHTPILLQGDPFYAFESLDAWRAAKGAQIADRLKPSFTIMLSKVPCTREKTLKAYKKVCEEKLFKKYHAEVDTIIALDKKEMGVQSLNQKSGSLVIRLVVPSAASLASLRLGRAMPIFLLGEYANFRMSVQTGNFKIIDVCGVSVSVQKCCGVIVGNPHSTPAACADFLAQGAAPDRRRALSQARGQARLPGQGSRAERRLRAHRHGLPRLREEQRLHPLRVLPLDGQVPLRQPPREAVPELPVRAEAHALRLDAPRQAAVGRAVELSYFFGIVLRLRPHATRTSPCRLI